MMNENVAIFSANDATEWTSGTWQGPHPNSISGVCTDTRALVPGALYIAIRGTNFDGHAFSIQAVAASACAAMVETTDGLPPDFPALVVEDTRVALRALAAGWRAKVAPIMVGITGSAGKTTVKEWTAHLLSALAPTARTSGNWNNDLGLPKSLLAMSANAHFGIFEGGTNHPGEIAPLATLLAPNYAILTNVGPVHIEFFGTEQAIANEKADLLRALPADGVAVLDADSPHFSYLAAQAPCPVVSVSASIPADYQVIRYDAEEGWLTVLERATGESHEIYTGQPGQHQVINALEALAMARQLGVTWADITERFKHLPRVPMRWERSLRHGVQWINDAYNANPLSMVRAIETFAALDAAGGTKIAVLGDMFELGEHEERLHRQVGHAIGTSSVDLLLAVGHRASTWLADAAAEAGMEPTRIHRAQTLKEARSIGNTLFKSGTWILLKGSRGMALEKVME